MRYARRVGLTVVLLLTLFVLAGCITVNTGISATSEPQSLTQFNADLVAALVNRDFDTLQGMMGNPFVLALWQSEGQALEPEAAIAVMSESYFILGASLTFVPTEIVESWMGGADPLAIWPPEISPVSALGVSGLGESGAGQAVLIVAESEEGRYYWYAILLAPDGFDASGASPAPDIIVIGQPTPISLLPTEVQQVLIVGPVGIFEGPGNTYQLIDTAVRGQTFPVLGVSVDGQWWAVVCPGSTATCWITANPTFVQPVTGTKPTATPTWRPPRPTATPRPLPPTPTPQYIQRIQFAPGQNTAVVSGNASQFQNPQYFLFAYGGQRLRILIGSTPSGAANFSVRGESDGKTYKAINDPNREWSLTLPRTQDYRILVAATVAAYYQMEVSVTGTLPPTPTPPAAPERIQFAPGQDTAVRSAPLSANLPKQYIFRALVGQTARILFASPSSGANFAVQGVTDGIPYKTFDDPAREWSLLLPRTQDYLITILAPVNSSFTMELTVVSSQPTPSPTPERISFPAGADSAVRSGTVQPDREKEYVFRALAGQEARILLSSVPAGLVNFSVQGASDGVIYKSPADPLREWSFILPRTQDYLIALFTPGTAQYTMELSIPSTPMPTPTPERISFAPGQDTAERSGPLTANRAKQYIFRAQAGQEAQILADSPSTTTGFALEGVADGITYKAMSDPERAYALTLPRSQDYLITILATVNTSYYLELAIPGSPGPTPPPGPPERISFAPGADTAIRHSSLSGNTPKQYIFRAQSGQTAQVSLSATSSAANFSVEGVSDGAIYKPMDDIARVFSFTLPRTQDYLITLQSPTSTPYRLELYIPATPVPTPPPEPAERISFAPGSDSAVRGGPLYANTPKIYIFGAMTGQMAYLSLDSPSPEANFSVVGADDGIPYKSMGSSSTDFLFEIPTDQDYLITIIAPVNTSYTLRLTIPRMAVAPAVPEGPTVEPPTVEPPTVEPPTVEPPTVEPPTVEPPTVEPPTVEPEPEILPSP